MGKEVEALYTNGPAGGGGARKSVKEVIAIASIFVPEDDIKIETALWEGEGMKLREIAHSRTGDKGNISNISVIAYKQQDYETIKQKVTAEKVKEYFSGIVKGDVVIYELPNLWALNIVMYQALGGGVTRSLSLDTHGKSLSSLLMDMEI